MKYWYNDSIDVVIAKVVDTTQLNTFSTMNQFASANVKILNSDTDLSTYLLSSSPQPNINLPIGIEAMFLQNLTNNGFVVFNSGTGEFDFTPAP